MTEKRLWELIRYKVEEQFPLIPLEEIKNKSNIIVEDIKTLLKIEGYIITPESKSKK